MTGSIVTVIHVTGVYIEACPVLGPQGVELYDPLVKHIDLQNGVVSLQVVSQQLIKINLELTVFTNI